MATLGKYIAREEAEKMFEAAQEAEGGGNGPVVGSFPPPAGKGFEFPDTIFGIKTSWILIGVAALILFGFFFKGGRRR